MFLKRKMLDGWRVSSLRLSHDCKTAATPGLIWKHEEHILQDGHAGLVEWNYFCSMLLHTLEFEIQYGTAFSLVVVRKVRSAHACMQTLDLTYIDWL